MSLYILYSSLVFDKGDFHQPWAGFLGTTLDLPRYKPSLESQARKKAKNNYNSQNLITKSEGSRSTDSTFARRINEYLQTLRTLRNPRGIIDTHVERREPSNRQDGTKALLVKGIQRIVFEKHLFVRLLLSYDFVRGIVSTKILMWKI